MKITIEGARWTPSWVTIQAAVREMLEDRDGESDGILTRISRKDGGANYRILGEYQLTFSSAVLGEVTIELIVR